MDDNIYEPIPRTVKAIKFDYDLGNADEVVEFVRSELGISTKEICGYLGTFSKTLTIVITGKCLYIVQDQHYICFTDEDKEYVPSIPAYDFEFMFKKKGE